MKCGTRGCKEKATHYVSLVYDIRGETGHADGYACDEHTEDAETEAEHDPSTIEFEAKELPS